MRRFKWIEWNLDKIGPMRCRRKKSKLRSIWRMIIESAAMGRSRCFRECHRDAALRSFGVTTARATRFPTYLVTSPIQLFLSLLLTELKP